MKKIIAIFEKYREQIMYLIFGGLTTLINWDVSLILINFANTAVTTAVAWVAAVLFAYFTNRAFVFKERKDSVIAEILSFFVARLLSLGLDEAIMVTFVDFFGFNFAVVKLFAQVVVVLFNYFASKLVVFRKRRGKGT